MSGKTIDEMTAEIRAVNVEKGWRAPSGGPGANTLGDYIALLHSEVSEALEAYRDHRLADATRSVCGRAANGEEPCPEHGPSKPEGVGAKLADVLIRLLDTCDAFGIALLGMSSELDAVAGAEHEPLIHPVTFGDHLAWLHFHISSMLLSAAWEAELVLRVLVATARKFGIDLSAEYERKIAYNRTRPFQHGGRTLADRS